MKQIKDIYKHYGHCKTRIRYHIILVTKYRRKCLDPIKDLVFESFRYTEQHSNLKIHRMNIDNDHIHLLVSFPSKYSISQTISRLKQCSTNYIYRSENEYFKKFYWKRKRVLWSESYFCSTVGLISENKVLEYINNQ